MSEDRFAEARGVIQSSFARNIMAEDDERSDAALAELDAATAELEQRCNECVWCEPCGMATVSGVRCGNITNYMDAIERDARCPRWEYDETREEPTHEPEDHDPATDTGGETDGEA